VRVDAKQQEGSSCWGRIFLQFLTKKCTAFLQFIAILMHLLCMLKSGLPNFSPFLEGKTKQVAARIIFAGEQI